jgi:fatty acid desaturase
MGRDLAAGPPKLKLGNRSLAVHIARGVIGFAAIGLAIFGYAKIGWPAVLILPLAPLMMRGGPGCWLTGLFETIAYRRWLREMRKKGIVSPLPGVPSAEADNHRSKQPEGRTQHA